MNSLDLIAGFAFGAAVSLAACGALAWWFGGDE
jgi:hypothetical protein